MDGAQKSIRARPVEFECEAVVLIQAAGAEEASIAHHRVWFTVEILPDDRRPGRYGERHRREVKILEHDRVRVAWRRRTEIGGGEEHEQGGAQRYEAGAANSMRNHGNVPVDGSANPGNQASVVSLRESVPGC